MSAQLDPMNAITRQYADQMVKASAVQLEDSKSETIVKISKLLTDAVANQAPAAVIGSYERSLAKLSQL
jgi:hypothetical protein